MLGDIASMAPAFFFAAKIWLLILKHGRARFWPAKEGAP